MPVRNIIDGKLSLKSVNETDFSLSLNEIRDEISALTVTLSSPAALAKMYGFSPVDHGISAEVFANAPQPVKMLRASNRLVLPIPFLPKIKFIPGSQLNFCPRSGPLKFLKFFNTVNSNLKIDSLNYPDYPADYSPGYIRAEIPEAVPVQLQRQHHLS